MTTTDWADAAKYMTTPHDNLKANITALTQVYGRLTAIAEAAGLTEGTLHNIKRGINTETKHSTVCRLAAGISKHLGVKLHYQDLYSAPNSLRMARAIKKAQEPLVTEGMRKRGRAAVSAGNDSDCR